jgi:epoxyqueuosine reductase
MTVNVAVKSLIERLVAIGIDQPVAMPVKELMGYELVYNERKNAKKLSGFEPNFENPMALETYLSEWQTIIGMAIPYSLLPREQAIRNADAISRVSIMAWEWDYHHVIKDLLKNAVGDDVKHQIHVDSGPLPERSIALQMCLGKAGRNQMLIHPKYGTSVYLAYLLVDMPYSAELLEASPVETNEIELFSEEAFEFELAACCDNCYLCQECCPAKALVGDCEFDGSRCISTLTQKKGLLNDEEMHLMGGQLYGCDICQLVCPANKPLEKWSEPAQKTAHKVTSLKTEPLVLARDTANVLVPTTLLNMSQKEFQRQYGKMGVSWRGVKTSKRNALINMGNSGSSKWLQFIKTYIEERGVLDGEELTQTALWAIGQIERI